MTLCETYATLTPPVHILATDIDTNVLVIAARGVYPIERLDKLSAERKKRFFLKGTGAQSGMARVRPELGKLITFQPLQPAGGQLADFDFVRCNFLSKRHDLFRQGDPGEDLVPFCTADEAARLAVCRAFGKFFIHIGRVQATCQDCI